jgi:hypothetical protein
VRGWRAEAWVALAGALTVLWAVCVAIEMANGAFP